MSICTVDRTTYNIALQREYKRQLTLIRDQAMAMKIAREAISRAFVCEDDLNTADTEKDRADAKGTDWCDH